MAVQYERNDYDFRRGTFRVRGDVVEVFPVAAEAEALRVEFWGDSVERLMTLDPLKGTTTGVVTEARIYPASHYVTPAAQLEQALTGISDELRERLGFFRARGRLLEAQRLEQRTLFDMEMLREIGYCHGVENYSRHLSGRKPGQNPATLMDYLPKDAVVIIDESHVTVPADPRDVRGRPVAEGDARRVRVPPAVGLRQPAADVRGVRGARAPGPLRLRHAGTLRAGPGRRAAVGAGPAVGGRGGRRADHPARPGSWTR